MNALLLANLADTIGGWAIAFLIICGIVAVVVIVARVLKVSPPEWVVQLFWVVVAIVVGVLVIGFLVSLGGGQPALWFRG